MLKVTVLYKHPTDESQFENITRNYIFRWPLKFQMLIMQSSRNFYRVWVAAGLTSTEWLNYILLPTNY